MNITRSLAAVTLLAALAVPAVHARDARETARIVKGLAMQGGNQKVLEAMKVLEQEGFLEQMGDALADDGAASATAQAATTTAGEASAGAGGASADAGAAADGAEAPAAPGASEAQIVEIAFRAAEPIMSKHFGGKVKIGQRWVKESTRGGRAIWEVKIMPESLGIVSFFTTYTVDVDKATLKVTRVK